MTGDERRGHPLQSRKDGRILNWAVYVVLGVTMISYKEILNITVDDNKSSKLWMGMLNGIKNRSVRDVLFFCVGGLPGFKEAVRAVFPPCPDPAMCHPYAA